MSAQASDFGFCPAFGARVCDSQGPMVEHTGWGYLIREAGGCRNLRAVAAMAGRFFGAILLMSAVGLWLLPGGFSGGEILAMKMAVSAMFAVIGATLLWAGSSVAAPEFQIDTAQGEIRIGRRGFRGDFHQLARVTFPEISSVFLMRSKTADVPARLYLRLAGSDQAVELAIGAEPSLEPLRARLAKDIAFRAERVVQRCAPRKVRLRRIAV